MAVLSDNKQILKELESLREELKTRDERIERLEKVFLFLVGSDNNLSHFYQTPQNMIENMIKNNLSMSGRIQALLEEYGSAEKVVEEFLSICDTR